MAWYIQQGLLSTPKLESLTEDVTRKLDLVNSYIEELETSVLTTPMRSVLSS